MDFHYDEAFKPVPISAGNSWELVRMSEMPGSDDIAALAALTNNFIP